MTIQPSLDHSVIVSEAPSAFGLTVGYGTAGAILPDTGALVSIADQSLATEIQAEVKPLTDDLIDSVTQADGSSHAVIGYVKGAFRLGDTLYPHRVYIRADSAITEEYNMILGVDILDKIGKLTIDFAQRKIFLTDVNTNTVYVFNWWPNDENVVLRSRPLDQVGAGSTTPTVIKRPDTSIRKTTSENSRPVRSKANARSPSQSPSRGKPQSVSRGRSRDKSVEKRTSAVQTLGTAESETLDFLDLEETLSRIPA